MFLDDAAYEDIRLGARIRPLVPFIGAGMSQLAGCPGWDEFANKALRFFVTGRRRKLTHAELDQLKDLPARVKLALALDLQDSDSRIDFTELLRSSTPDKEKRGDELYTKLGAIASSFVTTNYDDKLDTGAREIFYRREQLTAENLLNANSAVFHIHGSMREPDSMVRTTEEYLTRYANHDLAGGQDGANPFLFFLDTLFASRTVLFIGYP
jgi:hypothetical protein